MVRSKHLIVVLFSLVAALCLASQVAFAAQDGIAEADSAKVSINLKALTKDTVAGTPASATASIKVRGYTAGKGWKGWKKGGKTVGFEDARLQALSIKLTKSGVSGGIKYRVNTYNKGWMSWVSNSTATGSIGNAIMGVQVKLTGDLANSYDIVYRVNHAKQGWLPWAMNGRVAGCTSKQLGINQIQIKLVKKDKKIKVADGAYAIGLASNSHYALAVPNDKVGSDVQMASLEYTGAVLGERFYVRNEGDGTISIQSAASGKFLCESDEGDVVQRPDSADASFRWTLDPWNGGYLVKNAASGRNLALSGKDAVTGKAKCRWTFSSVGLVPDGNYLVFNQAQDKVLDLKNMSTKDKANIRLREEGASDEGAQTFSFTNKGSNIYRIDNAFTFKPIEVANGSTSEGANVRQSTWSSSNAQKWSVDMDRDGAFLFTNSASGKVMSAKSGGKDGANVVSKSDGGDPTQRWMLEASSYEMTPGVSRAISKTSGETSSTNYLILVDLTNHWLTIFKKDSGSWKPYKDWQISCGSPSNPTVTGHFTVGSKGYSFGDGYTCYYWTQFYEDYLFHSIKYYQGTFKVKDGRLGMSISMGCVRMALDNAKWIYNNIPSGTKVYIYR